MEGGLYYNKYLGGRGNHKVLLCHERSMAFLDLHGFLLLQGSGTSLVLGAREDDFVVAHVTPHEPRLLGAPRP